MRKSGGFAVVCLPHASFVARKVPAFLPESKGKANRSRRRESAGHWAGSALLSKDYTTKWLGMEEEITDRKAETDKKCAHARNHVFMRGMDTARRTTRGLERGLLALFVFCAQFL